MKAKLLNTLKTLIGLNRNGTTQLEAAIWLFILSIPLGLTLVGIASLKWIALGLFLLVCSTNLDQTVKVLRNK